MNALVTQGLEDDDFRMRVLRSGLRITWPDFFNQSSIEEVESNNPITSKHYATGRVNACPEKDPTSFDCTPIVHCGNECLDALQRRAWRTAFVGEREGLVMPNTSTIVDGVGFVHAHKKSVQREGAVQPSARFMAGRTWPDVQRGTFRVDKGTGLESQVFELEKTETKRACSDVLESGRSTQSTCFEYVSAIARLECDSAKTPWCHSRG
jgi:hypothetical protein